MKKISDDEFREYLEYKKFMNEEPGAPSRKKKDRKLSLGELDLVRAARGDQDFEAFMNEMRARTEREEK